MRRALPLAVALALALALLASPAGAHGFDYVTADPQVSADGTVVVEAAFATRPAWLALHADDGGEPGRVIGHTRLPAANRFYAETRVAIAPAAWANWTVGTVHPVLHADDGDDEFDPATDRPLGSPFGRVVSAAAVVERGPEPAYVSGEGDYPLAISGPEVTVRAVALPGAGHLVVRHGNASGPVVGHVPLEAGTHRNVTVPLEAAFYESLDGSAPLTVTPRLDDGDGEFDDEDAPITAGNATVRSRFSVQPDTGTDGDPGVITAEPTPTLTPTPPPSPTPSPTPGTATTTDGPGFGALLALVALVVISAVAWWRR